MTAPAPDPGALWTVPETAADPLRHITGALRPGPMPVAFPPCVYFLLRAGRVVYVGQSTSLMARVASHLASEHKQFDQVLFLPVESDRLGDTEIAFIRYLRPIYNKGNRGMNTQGPSVMDEALLRRLGVIQDGVPLTECLLRESGEELP